MSDITTADLEVRAELAKLRKALNLSDEAVAAMAGASATALRRLRRSVNAKLHAHRRDGLRKLARLATLLPRGYLARLATDALGPKFSGRLVSQMDPVTGSKIAKRLPAPFLADAAAAAEPGIVREIIRLLPAEVIRDAALVLVEREDYILMGQFADALSAPAIREVVGAVKSDAVLLKIAFYMEETDQLTKVVRMIDNDRIGSIMRTGTSDQLLPEALFVIDHVEGEVKQRLANIMGEQDEAVLNDLVSVAREQNLWGPVLRGLGAMAERYHRKIVNLPAVKDAEMLGELVRAAGEEGLLEVALPLAKAMRADYQKVVAEATLREGEELAEAALWAAHNSDRWDVILDLAQHLGDEDRNTLARLPIAHNRQALASLLKTAAQVGKMDLLLDFAKRFDPEGLRMVVDIGLKNTGDLLEAILAAARVTDGGWEAVATAVAAVEDDAVLQEIGRVYHRQSKEDQKHFDAAAKKEGIWDRVNPAFKAAA